MRSRREFTPLEIKISPKVRLGTPYGGVLRTNGVYLDRTFGRDSYYCAIDGDIDARTGTGEETGTVGFLPGETETMGPYVQVLHR